MKRTNAPKCRKRRGNLQQQLERNTAKELEKHPTKFMKSEVMANMEVKVNRANEENDKVTEVTMKEGRGSASYCSRALLNDSKWQID